MSRRKYNRDSDGLGTLIVFIVLWALFALVDLAVLGVIVWAIIKLVGHFTG